MLRPQWVSDCRAKRVLQEVFPGVEVVMIPLGREILLGGGKQADHNDRVATQHGVVNCFCSARVVDC